MEARLDVYSLSPDAVRAMLGLGTYVDGSGLESSLVELVKIRVSQINGCAYCIDMHTKDARAAGETEQRIYVLDAWREAPFYSDRERVALEWTEAVTRLEDGEVRDEVFEAARKHFGDEELVNLTIAIIATNGWNRLNIAFRPEVGSYRPGMFDAPKKVA